MAWAGKRPARLRHLLRYRWLGQLFGERRQIVEEPVEELRLLKLLVELFYSGASNRYLLTQVHEGRLIPRACSAGPTARFPSEYASSHRHRVGSVPSARLYLRTSSRHESYG